MMRKNDLVSLIQCLDGFETEVPPISLWDKAAQGYIHSIHAKKGKFLTSEEEFFKTACMSVRILVENVNARLTRPHCFQTPWRHSYRKQDLAFEFMANLVEIGIHIDQPLRVAGNSSFFLK